MDGKKAFVFDTNFIIQNNKLDEVVSSLNDRFSVYVTQISVQERIAQQCKELKLRFDEFTSIKEKYSEIADIELKTTYEKRAKEYQTGMQKNYEKLFEDKLIPFSNNEEMFEEVLRRAFNKIAPFSSADNASDKGFKDALIWLSIVEYFKENGEDEIVFVTDDNGFIKSAKTLCEEFTKVTGKNFEIRPNSYYKDLLKPELIEENVDDEEATVPDVSEFRKKIRPCIKSITEVTLESHFGDEYCEDTFSLSDKVDAEYVEEVLNRLSKVIIENMFESGLSAKTILELDDRITNTEYLIPMNCIEAVLALTREAKKRYPEYLLQYYSAVASIINENYRPKPVLSFFDADDDGELPF